MSTNLCEMKFVQQALSILQTKAENEISKAQNLILEKDAELLAAEDSLSGLVEVTYFRYHFYPHLS